MMSWGAVCGGESKQRVSRRVGRIKRGGTGPKGGYVQAWREGGQGRTRLGRLTVLLDADQASQDGAAAADAGFVATQQSEKVVA